MPSILTVVAEQPGSSDPGACHASPDDASGEEGAGADASGASARQEEWSEYIAEDLHLIPLSQFDKR